MIKWTNLDTIFKYIIAWVWLLLKTHTHKFEAHKKKKCYDMKSSHEEVGERKPNDKERLVHNYMDEWLMIQSCLHSYFDIFGCVHVIFTRNIWLFILILIQILNNIENVITSTKFIIWSF